MKLAELIKVTENVDIWLQVLSGCLKREIFPLNTLRIFSNMKLSKCQIEH